MELLTWIKNYIDRRKRDREFKRVTSRLIAGKEKRTKRQHYVPQCYLKGFSRNEDRIWAFDKPNQRRFETTVSNVAVESGFYDLHFEVEEGTDNAKFQEAQLGEAGLAELDGALADVLRLISALPVDSSMTEELRNQAVFQLIIQNLRTREAREQLIALITSFQTEMAKLEHGDKFPDLLSGDIRISVEESHHSQLHLKHIFNPELWGKMREALIQHICILLDFETQGWLFTSDHPVAIHGGAKSDPNCGIGVGSKGVEIYWPLSSTRLMVLLDRETHSEVSDLHLKCVPGNSEVLKFSNVLQAQKSLRWLFCEQDAFGIIQNLIHEFPHLAAERQFRFTVTGPLGQADY